MGDRYGWRSLEGKGVKSSTLDFNLQFDGIENTNTELFANCFTRIDKNLKSNIKYLLTIAMMADRLQSILSFYPLPPGQAKLVINCKQRILKKYMDVAYYVRQCWLHCYMGVSENLSGCFHDNIGWIKILIWELASLNNTVGGENECSSVQQMISHILCFSLM